MAAKRSFLVVFAMAVSLASIVDCEVGIWDLQQCVTTDIGDGKLYTLPYRLEAPGEEVGEQTVTVQVANDFSVQYQPWYKYVTNKRSNETFVLYQCGTSPPDAALFPLGTKFISLPVRSMAVAQTVAISFLEILGLRPQITRLDATWVSSPCIQKMAVAGAIKPLEALGEWGNATLLGEQVQGIPLVLVDEWTKSNVQPYRNNYVAFDATTDPGALKRAEWIKYLSLFFNKEAEANAYFADINARYNCFSTMARSRPDKPTVAWIFYSDYADFSIRDNEYMLQLTEDAGGRNVDSSLMRSYATPEELHDALKNVDVVIDTTYDSSPAKNELADFLEVFGLNAQHDLPFLERNQIYRVDRLLNTNGGLDWFEGAIAQPDLVLQDLIRALHPNIGIELPRAWLRRIDDLDTMRILTAAHCTDPSSPFYRASLSCAATGQVNGSTPAPPPPSSGSPHSAVAALALAVTSLVLASLALLA
eukprot:jgi/Mesvir1/150/Mv13514-RA.1